MILNLKITIKCPKWCQEGWLWQRKTTRAARTMIRKCQEISASQSYKAQLFHLKKKAKKRNNIWARWSTTKTKTRTMIKTTNWQSTQQQLAFLTSPVIWSTLDTAPSEAQRGPPATTKSTLISKSNHLARREEKTIQMVVINQGSRRRWLHMLVRIVMETLLNRQVKILGVILPTSNRPTSVWMNQTFLCKNEKISSL